MQDTSGDFKDQWTNARCTIGFHLYWHLPSSAPISIGTWFRKCCCKRILLPTLLFLLLLHNRKQATVVLSLDKGIRHRRMLWLDPLVIILTDFATWKNIGRNAQKLPNIGKKKTITLAFSLLQIDCYCFGFTMSLDKDQTRLSSVDLIGDIFPRRWVLCNKRTRVSIPLVGGAPTPPTPSPTSSPSSHLLRWRADVCRLASHGLSQGCCRSSD